MLTEREKKWLEERENKCLRCLYYSGDETIEGICFWCSDKKKFMPKAYSLEPYYGASAEFEARTARRRALMASNSVPLALAGRTTPNADFFIKMARIYAEGDGACRTDWRSSEMWEELAK